MVNIKKKSSKCFLSESDAIRILLLFYLTDISPLMFNFFIGEVKPKKQSKKKRRQRNKAPLTRKQRIRQHIRKKMLHAKAAIIEVCVILNHMI